MHSVALVISIALLEFMVLGFGMVGYARSKYGVKAPATSGHEIFERHFRVHYNTLEHLIVFVPSVWFFGQYVSVLWATILGALFIVARIACAVGYVVAPEKREFGSALSTCAVAALLLGSIYGASKALLG